jgi:hypothetical protein
VRIRRFLLGSTVAMALVVSAFAPLWDLPGVAGASPLAPCTHLVVATTTMGGAGGTGEVTLLFANAGARCEVRGYPHVSLFNSSGLMTKSSNQHKSSYIFAEPRPAAVVLSRDEVASVGLSWSDNPVNDQSFSKSCPRAAWLDVTLPSGADVGEPTFRGAPCGGSLFVTPFELGPVPEQA